MKKLENYCSIIFLFLLATTQVKAQSVDVVIRENGTERKESIDLPKSMTYPLDSLLNDWKAKNYIDLGKDCSTAEVNPLFSDSVYIDRLSRIPAVMEMPYNDIVRKFIDMYAGRLRNQVSFMLSACNFCTAMSFFICSSSRSPSNSFNLSASILYASAILEISSFTSSSVG